MILAFINSLTINAVLLIVAVLLLATALFMYFGYLKIASELYERVAFETTEYDDSNLPNSPYRMEREYSTSDECDKYYIYKGSFKATYQEFSTAKKAQKSMNELEQIGGFKRSKVV